MQPSDQLNNQNEVNKLMTQIMLGIATTLYKVLGPDDLSMALSVSLDFDNLQRVSQYNNLMVGEKPVTPPFDLTEDINIQTEKILSLPNIYQLKSLQINVEPGGKINLNPIYLS